jgi:multiple sugar transport system substrate-binding protein
MSNKVNPLNGMTRREFLRVLGLTASGMALGACAVPATPSQAPAPAATEAPAAAPGPAWATAPSVPKPDKLYFIYWPWGTTEDELVAQFESDWGVPVEKMAEANVEPLYAKVNTMYAAGEQLDVIKALTPWQAEWIDNEVIQSFDGLPGVEDYKKDMNALCLQTMEKQGKMWGLPYYQSFFIAAFFEDHFEAGGITAPPTTYEELLDQALKLKKDGVSEHPLLFAAGQGAEHLTFQFYNLVHNWGGTVFDQDVNPTLGPGSIAREALTWWYKTFQEWEVSAPESLELRYIPACKAFWTGKYSFHMFPHHYYMSLLNSQEESPIVGRVHQMLLPNEGATLGWTELETLASTSASREWAWMLLQYVGGKTKDGVYTIAKAYAIDAMLGSGFDVVNRDPEVKEAWSKWTDVDLNLQQWEKAAAKQQAVPAMLKPWHQKWQDAAQVSISNCLGGQITPDQACDEMIAKHKELIA